MDSFVPIKDFLKKDWPMHQQREPNVRRHGRRNHIPIDDFDDDNEVNVENDDFQASEVEMGDACRMQQLNYSYFQKIIL